MPLSSNCLSFNRSVFSAFPISLIFLFWMRLKACMFYLRSLLRFSTVFILFSHCNCNCNFKVYRWVDGSCKIKRAEANIKSHSFQTYVIHAAHNRSTQNSHYDHVFCMTLFSRRAAMSMCRRTNSFFRFENLSHSLFGCYSVTTIELKHQTLCRWSFAAAATTTRAAHPRWNVAICMWVCVCGSCLFWSECFVSFFCCCCCCWWRTKVFVSSSKSPCVTLFAKLFETFRRSFALFR